MNTKMFKIKNFFSSRLFATLFVLFVGFGVTTTVLGTEKPRSPSRKPNLRKSRSRSRVPTVGNLPTKGKGKKNSLTQSFPVSPLWEPTIVEVAQKLEKTKKESLKKAFENLLKSAETAWLAGGWQHSDKKTMQHTKKYWQSEFKTKVLDRPILLLETNLTTFETSNKPQKNLSLMSPRSSTATDKFSFYLKAFLAGQTVITGSHPQKKAVSAPENWTKAKKAVSTFISSMSQKNTEAILAKSQAQTQRQEELTDSDHQTKLTKKELERRQLETEEEAKRKRLLSTEGQKATSEQAITDALNGRVGAVKSIEEAQTTSFRKKMLSLGLYTVIGSGFIVSSILFYKWAVKQFGRPAVLDPIKLDECRDLSEMVISPKLKGQLEGTIEEISTLGEMYNILLHGPPGTGKSFFGKGMAKRMHTVDKNVEFFFTSGSRFTQMTTHNAAKSFTELMDYTRRRARKGKKRVIIFIDEAERIFAARYGTEATSLTRALTEAFLAAVPAPSNDGFMFIMATNHPEQLDSAVFDRTSGHQFEIGLPELPEREQLIEMYLRKAAEKRDVAIPVGFNKFYLELAQRTRGFSARGIEELCNGIVRVAARQDGLDIKIARLVTQKQAEAQRAQITRTKKALAKDPSTNIAVTVKQEAAKQEKPGFWSWIFG